MNREQIGYWVGHGRGAQFARASLRVTVTADRLRAYGFGRTSQGEVEVFEFEGAVESDNRAVLDLVDYVTDNPNTNPPSKAQIIVTYKDEPRQLEVQFATDIGTQGSFWLRPAKLLSLILLSIPMAPHRWYRSLKYYFRLKLRYIYLLLVILLAVLSIFGKTQDKITSVEAVLLLFPLVFLFLDHIKGLIATLALRKVGPVEFQSQESVSRGIAPDQIVNALHSEFGERLSLFSTLIRLLVPRTKALLRLMAADDKPLTVPEFNRMAKGIGVPDSDLQATLEVLIKSGCIVIDEEGKLTVQNVGRQFLLFEIRFNQFYQAR